VLTTQPSGIDRALTCVVIATDLVVAASRCQG
jgi:hypothetical protein